MQQTLAHTFRPVMNFEAFQEIIGGTPRDELNESLKPGEPLGIEARRMFVSAFVSTRRKARENAATRNETIEKRRELRRRIATIERSGNAAWDSEELLRCRRLLSHADAMTEHARKVAINIGGSLVTQAAVMDVFFERDFILDLLNVGRDVKKWIDSREHQFPTVELLSAGFADENERSKLRRDIEPMMWCVHRYQGSLRAPVEANAIEAAPEEVEALRAKLEEYRTKAAALVIEIQDESAAEKPKRNKKSASDARAARRGEAIEIVIATWLKIEQILIAEGRGFSLAQKLDVLKADPAKTEKRDIPDGVSLLELICALDIEPPFNGELFGTSWCSAADVGA